MNSIILLAGRILLCLVFLYSIIGQTMDLTGTQISMVEHSIPFAGLLLVVSLTMRIVGCTLVLVGYKMKFGALLLILFLLPVTFIYHFPFGATSSHMLPFLENMAVLGGLLILTVSGAGNIALE